MRLNFLAMAAQAPTQAIKPGPIIGIDLGTTNSLVAYCDEKGPRVLDDPHGRAILPSVVRFNDAGDGVDAIGHDALTHAIEYPHQTVFSIKRLMGRSVQDVEAQLPYLPYRVVQGPHNTARVQVGEKIYSPQEVSAMILRRLRDQASAALGEPVTQAVITVPAYFDDAQRQATRDAGRIAGLNVRRIVNEPTAAALAYNLDQRHDDATVAVFDLGGGTFDVSILRLHHSDAGMVDQVLATAGDTHLGGDDVDRMIIDLIQREVCEQFGLPSGFPPSTLQALRNLAEATKRRLSDDTAATLEIEVGPSQVYRRVLERAELESMMQPWVERALACCKQALRSSGLTPKQIDRVILVGGSTRIPLVRQRVEAFFGSAPYTALDPDQVVALGAGVQGSILAGVNREMLLLDVIPLSLGIETLGGAVAKLITANSTIPARATEMFSTSVDNQTNVKIHVLQGERELVADCRSLGQFELRGIPPMPAGLPKLEVTFLVDANGILDVSAVEKRSEKAAHLQIVPNHGLTREEVAQIEADSYAHAKEDMHQHRLIDLRNQARMDIRAIQRQLAKLGDALDPGYRRQIEQHIAAVQNYIDAPNPDADAFHQALHRMDQATVKLAELAIQKTLREEDGGKTG